MSPDRRRTLLLCVVIFAVAFGIRLLGIGWGLKNDLHNQSYHPDEPLIFDFIHRSELFRAEGMNEYYNYGTLYYAILRTAGFMGSAYGGVQQPEKLDKTAYLDPKKWDELNTYVSQFHLWGRYASAFFGALTAVLVFLILRRWVSTLGSLAGAAMVAFAPAHIEHSHFQTVDVISLFFVALATLCVVRLLRPELDRSKGWWKEALLAAVVIGISVSTRYSNAVMILPLGAALAIRRPKGWPLMAVAGAVVAFIAFCATTPGFVTDNRYFMDNFRYQSTHAATGHGLVFLNTANGFVMQFQHLLTGISMIGAVLGLFGLIYAAIRKHTWAWVLLAFFVPYYISIGRLEVKFLRYGFPLYVGVACGFGYAISTIQRRFNNRWLAAGVGALSMIGINAQDGVRGAATYSSWMMGPDPRDEAARLILSQTAGKPGSEVGLLGPPYFWTPPVFKDAVFLTMKSREDQNFILNRVRSPQLVKYPESKPEYVTYTSYESDDILRLRDLKNVPPQFISTVVNMNSAFDQLAQEYGVVKVFGEDRPKVHDLDYVRPTVWVLRRKS